MSSAAAGRLSPCGVDGGVALLDVDDLPFLIEDLFGSESGSGPSFHITAASVTTGLGEHPRATMELEYQGMRYSSEASGDGGYDAFMNALKKTTDQIGITLPRLQDYEIRIPPGGKTDALVEAVIIWQDDREKRNFRTVGVDSDQLLAAIKATEKMLNRLDATPARR